MTVFYHLALGCPWCDETVHVVESFDEPIAIDQDVPTDAQYCTHCGLDATKPSWDRRQVHRVERVLPASEASNPVERAAEGQPSGVGGGIELAPCPECGSLRTFWDELADEDVESGHCDDCGESFALEETIVVDESDLVDAVDGWEGSA